MSVVKGRRSKCRALVERSVDRLNGVRENTLTKRRRDAVIKAYQRKYPDSQPLEECSEFQGWSYCHGHAQNHGSCVTCGRLTCVRRMWIDSKTLRRKRVFRCDDCTFFEGTPAQQQRLQAQRTRTDWEKVSTPVDPSAIVPERMAEQFPGRTRTAIRAFLKSDADVATVAINVGQAALQETIASLGLSDELYAEQRDETVVLRKAGPA